MAKSALSMQSLPPHPAVPAQKWLEINMERRIEEQSRQKDAEQQCLGQMRRFKGMQQPKHKAGENQGHRVGNGQGRCTAIPTAATTTKSKIKMISVSIPVPYLRPSLMVTWPATRSAFQVRPLVLV